MLDNMREFEREFEIIELKGNGHPDTLTDLIVEGCSRDLEVYYLREFGRVLHYNLDKALFSAGNVKLDYGGGIVYKVPTFILGGQATFYSTKVLEESIRNTIKKYLPNLNKFYIEIKTSSASNNLSYLCNKMLCNDTSFGVGYFPYSDSENKVLSLRDLLEDLRKSGRLPLGEDYKIMSTPNNIVISVPFYADKIHSKKEYDDTKSILEGITGAVVNPENTSYLTLSGSSIECGDDGQVGRGNRFNGLITPCRPMSMEAYSGKNNQTHIGKIYNRLAFEEAKKLYEITGEYTEVYLVGKIGYNINDYEKYIYKNNSKTKLGYKL